MYKCPRCGGNLIKENLEVYCEKCFYHLVCQKNVSLEDYALYKECKDKIENCPEPKINKTIPPSVLSKIEEEDFQNFRRELRRHQVEISKMRKKLREGKS